MAENVRSSRACARCCGAGSGTHARTAGRRAPSPRTGASSTQETRPAPGSKNKPKPPKTVPAEEVAAPAPEPAHAAPVPATTASPAPEPPTPPVEPVRMTPAQERALRYMERQDRYMELLARNTIEM